MSQREQFLRAMASLYPSAAVVVHEHPMFWEVQISRGDTRYFFVADRVFPLASFMHYILETAPVEVLAAVEA